MNQYVKAYNTAENYGSVSYADPHTLITKMFDGAMKRIAQAKGSMQRQEVADKGEHINRAIAIIGSLDACLDHDKGGELSQNLASLYEYMNLRLVEANIENSEQKLDEVIHLLTEIRGAWVQIPQQLGKQPEQQTQAG